MLVEKVTLDMLIQCLPVTCPRAPFLSWISSHFVSTASAPFSFVWALTRRVSQVYKYGVNALSVDFFTFAPCAHQNGCRSHVRIPHTVVIFVPFLLKNLVANAPIGASA